MASDESRLTRPWVSFHRRLRDTVRRWLAEGVEAGEIRPDIDLDAVALVIVGMVRGIGLQALGDPDAVAVDAVVDRALDTLTRSLTR